MYTGQIYLAIAQPQALLRGGAAKRSLNDESALSQSLSDATYSVVSGLARLVGRVAHAVIQHRRRRQAIYELRALSDHLLADIGIVRYEIPSVVDGMQLGLEEDTRPSASTLAA